MKIKNYSISIYVQVCIITIQSLTGCILLPLSRNLCQITCLIAHLCGIDVNINQKLLDNLSNPRYNGEFWDCLFSSWIKENF